MHGVTRRAGKVPPRRPLRVSQPWIHACSDCCRGHGVRMKVRERMRVREVHTRARARAARADTAWRYALSPWAASHSA